MIVFNIKRCTKCKIEKSILFFDRLISGKFQVSAECKDCCKERKKEFYKHNKNKYSKRAKQYYKKNQKKLSERQKEYRKNNPKKVLEKEKRSKRKRYKTNINFKTQILLRNRLYQSLVSNIKSQSTMELLGCSIEYFKIYLESKFQDGMTWKNWSLNGWHIDHIRPVSSFDFSDPDQQKICFHYTNLQPLWAKDNLQKANKIIL
jgi:hypothetical protein